MLQPILASLNHDQKLPSKLFLEQKINQLPHDDLSVSKAIIVFPLFAATEASAVLVSTVVNPVTVHQTAQTSRW